MEKNTFWWQLRQFLAYASYNVYVVLENITPVDAGSMIQDLTWR